MGFINNFRNGEEMENSETNNIIEYARETAMFGMGLLSKNYESLPKVQPEIITTAFLASIIKLTVDAMPTKTAEKMKQDVIELLKEV